MHIKQWKAGRYDTAVTFYELLVRCWLWPHPPHAVSIRCCYGMESPEQRHPYPCNPGDPRVLLLLSLLIFAAGPVRKRLNRGIDRKHHCHTVCGSAYRNTAEPFVHFAAQAVDCGMCVAIRSCEEPYSRKRTASNCKHRDPSIIHVSTPPSTSLPSFGFQASYHSKACSTYRPEESCGSPRSSFCGSGMRRLRFRHRRPCSKLP